MNVLEAVRALGVAIQADDRYQIYAAARAKNDGDDALQERIGAFNLLRLSLDQAYAAEERDEEQVQKLNEQMREVYREIMANPSMVAYHAAKSAMDELMEEVNSILSQTVAGADPMTCEPAAHACSGDCGSCGGCH